MALLSDREAQSWSVKLAIPKGFDFARGRHQEVHPPCKATWPTPANYITYCDKLGILFALTDGTDTTALDTAAGAGGSRPKSRMEELLYRRKYVLFFVEVPKTEDGGSTYIMMYIPNQYELKKSFEENYSCGGSNATNFEMPNRRHVLVVPRFTALKIAEKHRCLGQVFGTPRPAAKVLSRTENDDVGKFWLHDAPVVFFNAPRALRQYPRSILSENMAAAARFSSRSYRCFP